MIVEIEGHLTNSHFCFKPVCFPYPKPTEYQSQMDMLYKGNSNGWKE